METNSDFAKECPLYHVPEHGSFIVQIGCMFRVGILLRDMVKGTMGAPTCLDLFT